jgi:hypothetical protein
MNIALEILHWLSYKTAAGVVHGADTYTVS